MKLIQQLIQIDSVSGKEGKIQKFISEHLTKLGFKPIDQAGNVVVKIDGVNSNLAIIFDAHVDTVSAGEASGWTHTPLSGYLAGDKVYGLGASDNKASVASLLLLAKELSKTKPNCDVWLAFVVSEEVDGSGTKNFIGWFAAHHQADYRLVSGVIMEPTNLAQIEIGHRGNVFVKITTQGKSGHGSKPLATEHNAVLQMANIAGKLQTLNGEWGQKYPDLLYGPPTLGVGTSIQAGNSQAINKFADSCMMTVDVRTVPAMHDQVLNLVEKYLNDSRVKVECAHAPAGYGYVTKDNAIVLAMKKVMPDATLVVSPGATDQCFFTQAGIPALIIGPGVSEGIHQANEYCESEKIEQCTEILRKFIAYWVKMMANAPKTQ